jgi:hypothetical protein
MSLWHAVLSRLIVRRAIDRTELALTGNSTLELVADFIAFEPSASRQPKYARGEKENRQALHLLILGSESFIAIADCGCSGARRGERRN